MLLMSMTMVPGCIAEESSGVDNSAIHIVHRHQHTNAPGGRDENLSRWQAQCPRRRGRHFLGVALALRAGAGIRISRINDDGASLTTFEARYAKLHRSGAHLVGREQTRHTGRAFGNDQREIEFLALVGSLARAQSFDVAKNPGCKESLWRND